MASKTDIANLALVELGADTVTDLAGNGKAERAINAVFDTLRDAVLRAHPWNFAMELVTIAADGAGPAFGFARSYTLPADPHCLRVWKLGGPTDDPAYKVRGRKIHTDATAPLKVEYIKRETDPAKFDANFTDALAARIAWAVAYRITKSRTLQADMKDGYFKLLAEARSVDAQEGTPDENDADDFLGAREI